MQGATPGGRGGRDSMVTAGVIPESEVLSLGSSHRPSLYKQSVRCTETMEEEGFVHHHHFHLYMTCPVEGKPSEASMGEDTRLPCLHVHPFVRSMGTEGRGVYS